MGEGDILSKASREQLFHLQNGVDLASVRELAIELDSMDEHTFSHHVNNGRNDFSLWIKDVFGDTQLSKEVEKTISKNGIKEIIKKRIIELEEKELKRFGVSVPTTKLLPLEKYIENQLEKGYSEHAIREKLLQRGWKEIIVDLILEGNNNPYKDFNSVGKIEKIESFHGKLERLKSKILEAVLHGSSINDISASLKHQGWSDEFVDFIFYDIYKPHPNIKKLGTYIVHQVRDKNKEIEEVKNTLLKLGWKEYLVNSVIYGINEPKGDLKHILNHLESFAPEQEDHVKKFLLKMGWSENEVKEALRKKTLEKSKKELTTQLNLDGGKSLKESSRTITKSLMEATDTKLWKKTLAEYREVNLKDLINTKGELHSEYEYDYFYPESDVKKVKEEGRIKIYYSSQNRPLLVSGKKKYMILPQLIKRKCIVCNKAFSLTSMKEVEMWDATRTQKVRKFVCDQHRDLIRTFLGSTKILQV